MLGSQDVPVPLERRGEAGLAELVLTVGQQLGGTFRTGGQQVGHQAAHTTHPASQDLSYSSAVEVTMETKHLQYPPPPPPLTLKISLIPHWLSCFLLHIIFTVQLRRYCD